jgi:signal transduction histidine kinase
VTAFKSKNEPNFPLEQAAWPAFVVDRGGSIRRANAAAVALLGPALEGDHTSLQAVLALEGHETTAEQFLANWERSMPAFQDLKFKTRGGQVTIQNTSICAFQRDQEKWFLFQLLREAPEGGTKGASLEASVAHKQKLDCAMQLARTVAHDFNNALTSILGYTSLVLARIEPQSPWRSTLLQVEKAAERAGEVAQQLAAFTRPERDSSLLAPANLNTVLRRVIDTFRQTRADLTWQVELEPQLYAVRFDEAKVQQAFIKILENAVEAVGPDGKLGLKSRNLEIEAPLSERTVRLEPGNYVVVEVTDNGCGITPDVLPRVFEPFFTTKQGHRGLGLAWVYGIITNHRGGVTINSQPDSTEVRVYLPSDRRIVRERGEPARDAGGNQTILLVDDEETLLALGQTILSTYGYKVLVANSGAKALELLRDTSNEVRLVITDLVMPQMGGRELMEQIKRLRPNMPVLCTSGYDRSPRTDEHDLFLAKPYTSRELLLRVRQLLEDTR